MNKVLLYNNNERIKINVFSEIERKLINLVLKNNSWLQIERNKKHRFEEHCKNFEKYHNEFQKNWFN